MKKLPLFLVLSFFLIQCSKNDLEGEEQQEKPENLAISITIEGDLLNENREKILYISSEEGIIEGHIPLLNNQENLLTIQREKNTKYYAIIHDKLTYNGRTRHDFAVFENVESSDYTITATSGGIGGNLPNVDLYLVNTGTLEKAGMTGGGHWSGSSANGGTFNIYGTCLSKPGDYYASFKKENEPYARYFWTEDVEEDKSFTLNYEELPIATAVETQLPEHKSATVFVHGYTSEHPSARHTLSYGSTQGNQTYDSYLPEEAVFDYVSFSAGFFNGTTSYSFYSVSEVIPSSIQVPSFDFTINNFSVDDTDYTTTGNYSISNANFIISDDNINIQVLVKVFSEHNSRVSFSIGPLIKSLFEELPSLDAAQLKPSSITLSSYSHGENYEEAVKTLIEDNSPRSPGYFRETVSRRNN